MSTCPHELQAMLHVCQQWNIQNRIQTNTGQTARGTRAVGFLRRHTDCNPLFPDFHKSPCHERDLTRTFVGGRYRKAHEHLFAKGHIKIELVLLILLLFFFSLFSLFPWSQSKLRASPPFLGGCVCGKRTAAIWCKFVFTLGRTKIGIF